MTPSQKKAQELKDAQASAQSTSTAPAVAKTKIVTLSNATSALEVLTSVIAIMKSKMSIKPEQMGKSVIFRVINDGNIVARESGDIVKLFNTNASTPSLLAAATAMIDAPAFLALDLEAAKEQAKVILNSCSLSVAVGVDVAVQKNDDIKAKPIEFTSSKTGEIGIGLNFVGVQQAEVATKGDTSALDALLASLS